MKNTILAGVAAVALMVPASAMAQDTTETAAGKIEYIAKQQTGEWLASDLIGLPVQNTAGEELGDVNDLVVGPNGEVAGAVIGVGGFLGIGEKNVAISYEAMKTEEKDDETIVVLNTTKEALEAAPDFTDVEGQPLSVSKRWSDEASEQYSKAKEKAKEAYAKAKDKASETYNKAKESVSSDENTAVETQ